MSDRAINRFEWLKAVMQSEGLSPTAKNVAAALAVQFANVETGQINPSQTTLSNYLKVHKDTVKRVMRELKIAGWLLANGLGGRSKAPLLKLLTPGKIVPFRIEKRGGELPPQAKKRGGDLCEKGGQITPSHIKDKQSLEQRGGQTPSKRPECLDQFANRRFYGNAFDGPRLIPSTEHHALNEWNEWLVQHGLPRPCEMPIKQNGERRNSFGFWLPSKRPPATDTEERQASSYFEAISDWEVSAYAAQ
jgi:hypothetical protein